MAEGIEMVPEALPMSNSPLDTVQRQGGGGDIEMYNEDIPLRQTVVPTAQKGKGMGGIDMAGDQGLLSTTPTTPYNSKNP